MTDKRGEGKTFSLFFLLKIFHKIRNKRFCLAYNTLEGDCHGKEKTV